MKSKIIKIELAVVLGLVLLGIVGTAVVTGKMVCDGRLPHYMLPQSMQVRKSMQ